MGYLVNDSELWMYPVDGGAGVKLTVPGRFAHGPAFGGDERMLYFAAIPGATGAPGTAAPPGIIQHQLFMLDRTTGRVSQRSGHVGGAIRPTLSRDGRWLAYVGGNGENGTAIILRDLASGDERVLAERRPVGRERTHERLHARLGVHAGWALARDVPRRQALVDRCDRRGDVPRSRSPPRWNSSSRSSCEPSTDSKTPC